MKVVLFQPQIPQNTGNIVRTCSVTGCSLILIPPLGFSVADRHLKRAGLDYWEGVDVSFTENLETLLDSSNDFYLFSSKAKNLYTNCSYREDSLLIFGSETMGLPSQIHEQYQSHFATIPMKGTRCLNLATAVGIVVY